MQIELTLKWTWFSVSKFWLQLKTTVTESIYGLYITHTTKMNATL